MYFGNTSHEGLANVVWEVLANSLDQVLSGKATQIDVTVHGDGSLTVADDGEGFDTAAGADGTTALERAFTTLRDDPTADGHAPHVHLTRGLGLGPVSAVCDRVEVEVHRGSSRARQTFARGRALGPLVIEPADTATASGTAIRLHPDPEIFPAVTWDSRALDRRLVEIGSLWPALHCTFAQEVTDLRPRSSLTALLAREAAAHRGLRPAHPPILLDRTDGAMSARLALQWLQARWPGAEQLPAPIVASWCNFLRLEAAGGSHVDGLLSGLIDVFDTTSAHLAELGAGLIVVIDVKELDPQYTGPTRGRLDSPAMRAFVRSTVVRQLPDRLRQHPELDTELRARLAPP